VLMKWLHIGKIGRFHGTSKGDIHVWHRQVHQRQLWTQVHRHTVLNQPSSPHFFCWELHMESWIFSNQFRRQKEYCGIPSYRGKWELH
jgi:hypothetical protein